MTVKPPKTRRRRPKRPAPRTTSAGSKAGVWCELRSRLQPGWELSSSGGVFRVRVPTSNPIELRAATWELAQSLAYAEWTCIERLGPLRHRISSRASSQLRFVVEVSSTSPA